MDRRTFLVGLAGTAGLAGCVSGPDEDGGSTPSLTGNGPTDTPERRTSGGVSARFRVTNGHAPTEDAASADFDGETVTVTGTMDPTGCNEPTLAAVGYRSTDAVVSVRVGTEPRFGPTATVDCDNASYDYRCTVTVEQEAPAAVEVVHDYEGTQDRSFTLDRG